MGRSLAAALTKLLAEELAQEYRVESHLELRFESHYLRFLMPTTRGAEAELGKSLDTARAIREKAKGTGGSDPNQGTR